MDITTPKDIIIREDCPEEFRVGLLYKAGGCNMSYFTMRAIICRILLKQPDPSNWSEFPNIHDEALRLISNCKWFKVYDICEKFYQHMEDPKSFSIQINGLFEELGIGWKLEEGRVVSREKEELETHIKKAVSALSDDQLNTFFNRIRRS